MVSVRPIRRSDVAGAVQVLLGGTFTPEAERPDDEGAYWDAAFDVRQQGGVVLVAEDDGEIVGLCQVLVLHHFQHAGGKTAELESVHVAAARRGQGIGTMLLRAAEDHANAQGCYRVQLTSNVSRFDAHRFYERLGYVASHRGFKKALTR